MKKLLLILFALSSLSFAQTVTGISGSLPRDNNNIPSMVPVQLNPDGTFSLMHYKYTSPKDTLTGVDSTTYDFKERPYTGIVKIFNTKSGADTVGIYQYDADNARYTSSMVALEDMGTGFPVSNNAEIVIAGNTVKKFRIKENYPGIIRVKIIGSTGQAQDTLVVNFIESN